MKLKKLIFIISVLFVVSGIQSCTSYRATARDKFAADSDIYFNRLASDIKVDLKKSVKGSVTLKKKYAGIARDMAIWNALLTSDAHIVVDPLYKTTTTFKTITVEVEGYSGYFDNIHNATENEIMDYIFVQILSGNGILNVSWPEFRLFYRRLTPDVTEDDDDYLTDEELQSYYDEEVRKAKQEEEDPFAENNKTKEGSGAKKAVGGIVLGLLGVSVLYTLLTIFVF